MGDRYEPNRETPFFPKILPVSIIKCLFIDVKLICDFDTIRNQISLGIVKIGHDEYKKVPILKIFYVNIL